MAILVFNQWNKLQERATDGFQEFVDLNRVQRVAPMHDRDCIEANAVFHEQLKPAHRIPKGWISSLVNAIGIMQMFGTINGNPNKEIVFLQERAPRVIKQHAVGLQGVFDEPPRPVLLL
ncbi:MAG: hypothetical protein HQK96_19670 [Nitrospirae bacterium]|nr:hypothetical protein [Nitrospirota bacterium]